MGAGPPAVKSEWGCMTELDAAALAGCFVVEIGVRQAWPFLTFASNVADADPAEIRLYIDSTFSVLPAPPGSGDGSEDETRLWLLRLEVLLNETVTDVLVEADASLVVIFREDLRLRVSGHGAPWTTHEVWRLARHHH
ncbi:MAG: hypothetical protein JWL97_4450 [Gemmatimonadales bacterium]|jgi:hypothetical protein|nr:hypothetical protein [Gemmatimonadales bacterium]